MKKARKAELEAVLEAWHSSLPGKEDIEWRVVSTGVLLRRMDHPGKLLSGNAAREGGSNP